MKKHFFLMALLCLSATSFVSCSNDDEISETKQESNFQTKSTTSSGSHMGGTNPGNGDKDGDDGKDKGGIKIPVPKK